MDNPRRSPLETLYAQLAEAVQVLRDAREEVEADEANEAADDTEAISKRA